MNRRNRALLRVLAPLALMGVIFWFSAQPAAGHHAWWVIVFRKLGHITGYALLTAAWWWALRGVARGPVLWAVGISFVYACTDELHQTFVHGRTGTPRDVGIDAIGMAIAALLIALRRSAPTGWGRTGARGGASKSSLARSP
ncbi:MAG: VanZ family protein [Solirubrobacterales bacterium]